MNRKPKISTKLTPEKISEIQGLYYNGSEISEICEITDIKENTLEKAIRAGRIMLTRNEKAPNPQTVLTKSERSIIDNEQGMGKACVNTLGRVLSSKTGIPSDIQFSNQVDLHQAGVLLALPALLSNGLLKYEKEFYPDKGYYSITNIFLSLAFLALLRVKTLAQSTTIPAGDLGKAMGLDRFPEVKTLRKRIALFCEKANVYQWAGNLSKDWMQDYPDLSGILYIDGRVYSYSGHQTKMPKRYVSRLRLCMSGSTDYWVNDMTGQPFFVVSKTINSGMIEAIKTDILPRLEADVPNQPSSEELEKDVLKCRFMMVFDRECFSTDFFCYLWEKRISICTYNKNVKDIWQEEEFTTYEEVFPSGKKKKIELAERGVLLKASGSKKKIWAREIRKKNESGHQTSIITTNYLLPLTMIGVYMFARWSQENFFKYMKENFGIDALVSYMKEKICDTSLLKNPQYRKHESLLKSAVSKLNIRKAKFANYVLGEEEIEDEKIRHYIKKKTEILSQIKQLEEQVRKIKQDMKNTPRKIMFSQLPENEKFDSAINQRKHFLDTIKLTAYRAETAMANLITPFMAHPDEARTLLKQIYRTDANIKVDYDKKTLTVELLNMSFWKDDKIVQKLIDVLNETETLFPCSDMTVFYKLVSINNP